MVELTLALALALALTFTAALRSTLLAGSTLSTTTRTISKNGCLRTGKAIKCITWWHSSHWGWARG